MANLLSILRRRTDEIARLSQQDYLAQLAAAPWYPGQSTLYSVGRRPVESVPNSYLGYAEAAYASCTVVGACMRVRRDIFSQARFTWRELTDDGVGVLSHDDGLDLLERPWPNGTTGQLLTKMITDVDLCGNSYIVNEGDRLRWRRPDWMFVVLSGDPNVDASVDVLGYVYTPGGVGLASGVPYTVAEVAHWAPIPRPGSEYIGMSWMTSALREIQADKHATDHKLNFFVNGASLGPVFRLPATMTAEQFKKFRQANEEAHVGVENAYKPLYIGGGAEVTLSAATFQQLELKATVGSGETRIAANAGIHPTIVGLSEGLAGSSLNAGNFTAARRLVADITLHKLWQDACATLASFVEVPDGKELWIRESAIPFLREDAKDAAEIFSVDAQSATTLVREGYKPETVTPAVAQRNILMLEHSGALSVQLQDPGTEADGVPSGDGGPKALTPSGATMRRSWLRLTPTGIERAEFDPSLHPRGAQGRFRTTLDRIVDGLRRWAQAGGKGDPFEGFTREQLRRTAVARGVKLRRGASEKEIRDGLLDNLRDALAGDEGPSPVKKAAKKAAPSAPKRAAPKALSDEFDQRLKDAATGDDALASAPHLVRYDEAADKWTVDGVPNGDRVAKAVHDYWDYGQDVNRYLREGPEAYGRRGKKFTHGQVRQIIDGTDRLFESSHLDQPVVVWRGLGGRAQFGDDPDAWPDDLTGHEWTDRAYVSTSVDRAEAANFASDEAMPTDSRGVLARIMAPEGAPVLNLGEFEAGEMLLSRGWTFRVVRDHGWQDEDRRSGVRRQRLLDVEAIPPATAQASPAKKAAPKAPPQTPEAIDLASLRSLDDPEAIRDALDLHKIPELKETLREQKLPLSGRKRELVDRLVEHLSGGGDKPAAKKAAPKASDLLDSAGGAPDLADSVLSTALERQTGEGLEGAIGGPHGDELAFAIAERQGFDRPPTAVSVDEYDRLIAAGGQPLYRGIAKDEAGISGEEFADRLRSGAAYFPTGAWGSGIYTSRQLHTARAYGPNPLRMTLAPGARVIEWQDLRPEHEAFLAELDPNSAEYRVFSDQGRYAAARGYDAMRVRGSFEDEVLVFNRSALIVREPSTRAAAHELVGLTPAKKATKKAAKRPVKFPHGGEQMTVAQSTARQAEIDSKKGPAEVIADVHELLTDQASPRALRARIGTGAKMHGLPDTERDRLLAAVDDPAALRKALDDLAGRSGITVDGKPGDRTLLNGQIHQLRGEADNGDPVVVVTPGYVATLSNGETVRMVKAKVEPARLRDGAPAVKPDSRAQRATGDAALALTAVPLRSEAERKAFQDWAGGFRTVNFALRENGGTIPKANARDRLLSAGLDSALARSPLSEDIAVTRGIDDLGFLDGPPQVGSEWVDHGYVSTAAKRPQGITGIRPGGAQMRITVPAGVHAVSGPGLDPDEVLLDRGLRYRVTRAELGADRVWRLDVEVVPEPAAARKKTTTRAATFSHDEAREVRRLGGAAPYPGQRYRHGWIPIGIAEVLDSIDIDMVDAERLEPYHEVTDDKKLGDLVASMRDGGWKGPPVVVLPGRDHGWGPTDPVALTGAHRIRAARTAGVDVPVLDLNDLLAKYNVSLDQLDEMYGVQPDDERHIDSVRNLDQHLPADVISYLGLDVH